MIDLTTDYNTADFDGVYTHVKAVYTSVHCSDEQGSIMYQYGTTLAGAFVPGKLDLKGYEVKNLDGDDRWDRYKLLLSTTDEPCVDALCRASEQFLIDEAVTPGTWVAES
jgi:hypothetical protein